MTITKKKLVGMFALVLGCFMAAGNAFADDELTGGRNLPVDNNYHEQGDRKYDERFYPKTDLRGFTPADQIAPERNLPVNENFREQGDRRYDERYYPRTDLTGFTPASLGESRRNAPVPNDFHEWK